MARITGNTGLRPQPLQPKAAPVDTFVNPQAGFALAQLATGLSQLEPSLAHFSEVVSQRVAERDRLAGAEAARQAAEEGKTYREAIEKGIIRPDQSPWFRLGAEESFGRNAAHKYSADLQVAFAQSDAAQSTDPRDFDKFENQFRKTWTDTNLGDKRTTPYFNEAFGNQSEALIDGLRQNFAESAGARLVKAAGEAFHAEVFQHVLDGANSNQSVDQIATLVQLSGQRAIAGGMAKSIVNQMMASAITQAAKRSNNARVLDVMDKLKLGSGTLAGTSYGSQARELAENEIADTKQRQYVADRQAENDRNKKAEESIFSDAVAALDKATDPHTVDMKPFLERLRLVAPEKADNLLKMRDTWTDSTFDDEPAVVRQTFSNIFTKNPGEAGYVTVGYVSNLLAEQHIKPATFREMVSEIERRDKEMNGTAKLFNDDGYKQGVKRISDLFVSQFGFEKPENRWRAESAISEFTNDYYRWRQGKGKGASPLDVNQFITEEGQRLLKVKSDAPTGKDASRIPKGNTGPTVPDWKKNLVVDPTYIHQLETEATEIKAKKRNAFSPEVIGILQYAGVTPKEVLEFIKLQKQMAPVTITQ